MKVDLPSVKKIWSADIYRDGGSYGFSFDSDDGRWYEFFLKNRAFETGAGASHHAPAIYLKGSNDDRLICSLSWAEGKAFIADLVYDNRRFRELRAVVASEGKVQN